MMTFNKMVEHLRRSERDIVCDWLYHTDYGPERREWLVNYLMAHPTGLHVNRRGCIKTYLDKDVKKLIKGGTIRIERSAKRPSWWNSNHRDTILVYNSK